MVEKHVTFRFWKEAILPSVRRPAAEAPAVSPSRYFTALAGILLLTLAVFLPMFAWLAERFSEENSYYSHGCLMPLVAAYMLWQRREALRGLSVESDSAGLILIALGLAVHALGMAFSIGVASGAAFIIVLFGLSRHFLGRRITGVVTLPLLFLACMIPLPQVLLISIAFKMKMLAAWAASSLAAHLGIPLTCAGSSILLPKGTLTVGNQCSGMNSLISLLTLGLAFACLPGRRTLRRIALVLVVLPVALASNILRISFLIVASSVYGAAAVVEGPLHYGAGIVLWLSAVAMIVLAERVLPWK